MGLGPQVVCASTESMSAAARQQSRGFLQWDSQSEEEAVSSVSDSFRLKGANKPSACGWYVLTLPLSRPTSGWGQSVDPCGQPMLHATGTGPVGRRNIGQQPISLPRLLPSPSSEPTFQALTRAKTGCPMVRGCSQ